MEENKYWLKVEERKCVKDRDNIKQFVGECDITKEGFKNLGRNETEKERGIWEDDLDKEKGKVSKKLWKEKEKEKEKKYRKWVWLTPSQGIVK